MFSEVGLAQRFAHYMSVKSEHSWPERERLRVFMAQKRRGLAWRAIMPVILFELVKQLFPRDKWSTHLLYEQGWGGLLSIFIFMNLSTSAFFFFMKTVVKNLGEKNHE